MTLTDATGETKEITKVYPDGSFNCPFCSYAVMVPNTRCENPWCVASIYATVETATAAKLKAAKEQQEADERKRNHESAMRRIEEDKAEQNRAWSELFARAESEKKCQICLAKSSLYRPRLVRHRGECPNA